MAMDILKAVLDENHDIVRENEKVYKLGKYKDGGVSLMKIQIKSQAAVNDITRNWNLERIEGFRKYGMEKTKLKMKEKSLMKWYLWRHYS